LSISYLRSPLCLPFLACSEVSDGGHTGRALRSSAVLSELTFPVLHFFSVNKSISSPCPSSSPNSLYEVLGSSPPEAQVLQDRAGLGTRWLSTLALKQHLQPGLTRPQKCTGGSVPPDRGLSALCPQVFSPGPFLWGFGRDLSWTLGQARPLLDPPGSHKNTDLGGVSL
jgi:hypothetical protein